MEKGRFSCGHLEMEEEIMTIATAMAIQIQSGRCLSAVQRRMGWFRGILKPVAQPLPPPTALEEREKSRHGYIFTLLVYCMYKIPSCVNIWRAEDT
jgi:hypothetical protein